jgi:hypothetical protein
MAGPTCTRGKLPTGAEDGTTGRGRYLLAKLVITLTLLSLQTQTRTLVGAVSCQTVAGDEELLP